MEIGTSSFFLTKGLGTYPAWPDMLLPDNPVGHSANSATVKANLFHRTRVSWIGGGAKGGPERTDDRLVVKGVDARLGGGHRRLTGEQSLPEGRNSLEKTGHGVQNLSQDRKRREEKGTVGAEQGIRAGRHEQEQEQKQEQKKQG